VGNDQTAPEKMRFLFSNKNREKKKEEEEEEEER